MTKQAKNPNPSFTSEYVQATIVRMIEGLRENKIDPKQANATKELLNTGIRLEKLRLEYAKALQLRPQSTMLMLDANASANGAAEPQEEGIPLAKSGV